MTSTTVKPGPTPRNHRITTPVPLPRSPRPPGLGNLDGLAEKMKRKLESVFLHGFWYCHDCERMIERIEGEQGQPAHCSHCGSPRIDWNPPIHQVLQ
jgi:hypothetical protein